MGALNPQPLSPVDDRRATKIATFAKYSAVTTDGSPATHDPHRPGRTDGRSDCGTLDAVRATRDNDVVAIAAFILSAIAIVISGVSVWYVRQQTDSQKAVEKIERRRHHAERTPALTANPVNTLHDNLAEHLAPVNLTNTAAFDLHNVTAQVVLDRPGQTAIIAISTDSGERSTEPVPVLDVLRSGATARFDVVLGAEKSRAKGGVVRFVVEDVDGDSWPVELEMDFPHSPKAYFI